MPSIFQAESSAEATTAQPSTDMKNQLFSMLATKLDGIRKPSTAVNRTAALKRVKYDDYQIWRMLPSTQAHVDYLRELKESNDYEKLLWLKGPAMR